MTSLTSSSSRAKTPTAFTRVRRALEWPMAVLALAVIPALLLDDGASPTVHLVAVTTNWFVWLAFCAEFLTLLLLAPRKGQFVRESWFDLLIIAVSPPFSLVPDAWQGLRAARALRLLRLLRAFAFLSIGLKTTRRLLQHRRFNYVLLATSGVILLGALGIYIIERNVNDAITSPGDALWWAISTTTTVGYGDIYPTTGEGRLIAVALMLTGVGVIGVFTATIASFFMIEEEQEGLVEMRARLDQIDAKLERLLADRER
jgi:voltage-gated potassium channel